MYLLNELKETLDKELKQIRKENNVTPNRECQQGDRNYKKKKNKNTGIEVCFSIHPRAQQIPIRINSQRCILRHITI